MGVNLVQTVVLQGQGHAGAALRLSLQRGFVWIIVGLAIWPRLWGMDGIWLVVPIAELLTLAMTQLLGLFTRRPAAA